jgi:hypothetical protein
VNTPATAHSQFITIPSSAAPPAALLVKFARAHYSKGQQNKKRADDHFIAAGKYLAELKLNYYPTWREWEWCCQYRVQISTGRASELMALADGRKTVEGLRGEATERKQQQRLRDVTKKTAAYPEEEFPDDLLEDKPEPEQAAASSAPEPQQFIFSPDDYAQLIEALARSTPESRRNAIVSLISGRFQNQFEIVREATADFYQLLARAGQ